MTVNEPSSAATSHLDSALADARLTEELLNRLLRSTDISSFLDSEHIVDLEFTDYLHDVLERHGLTRADVVRASGLNPTVVMTSSQGKAVRGVTVRLCCRSGLIAICRRRNGCSVWRVYRSFGASNDVTPSSSGA